MFKRRIISMYAKWVLEFCAEYGYSVHEIEGRHVLNPGNVEIFQVNSAWFISARDEDDQLAVLLAAAADAFDNEYDP